ncbi:MICOS complex subunit MIC13 isoform X1 [Marmota marmota marmota]|uniref:MICOS complex subunit MIC13 isoform X1 n=1 Tax=Marmota marmota marmota TaxID=9994 RepID=UPI002092680A|nr:MICOS complex subunit MIC13 isoform X1 [Marmota marmota marmota]
MLPKQRVTYGKRPATLRKNQRLARREPTLGRKAPDRFLLKGSVAGGATYLVYDQDLLGPSDKSEAALRKAQEVVPPAVHQFSQYVSQQTGLQIPQLPAPPKINFPIRESWNSGIIKVMSALSAVPSKAQEYSREGWQYVKERTK